MIKLNDLLNERTNIQATQFVGSSLFKATVDLKPLKKILIDAAPAAGHKDAINRVKKLNDDQLLEFLDYMLTKVIGKPSLGGSTIEKIK